MHGKVFVHHALRGVLSDGRSAQDVGSGGQVEQVLTQRTHRHAVRPFCELARDVVPHIHARADAFVQVWLGHQPAPEERQQAAPQAEFHAVIHVLHHQQDRHVMRPARQHHRFQVVQRMRQAPPQRLPHPHRHTVAVRDERRRDEAHQRRAVRVTHRLDARHLVGVEDGRDSDALRIIDVRFARHRAEQRLGVGAHVLAQAWGKMRQGRLPQAQEQAHRPHYARGKDHASRVDPLPVPVKPAGRRPIRHLVPLSILQVDRTHVGHFGLGDDFRSIFLGKV